MTTQPPQPVAPRPRRPFHRLLVGLLICAGLTFVAALLPWAKAFGIAIAGTSGDGGITIFLAIVAALAVAIWRGRLWVIIVNLICAALVLLIGVIDLTDIQRLASGSGDGIVSTGIGLWLTTLVGAAWTAVAIVAIVKRKQMRVPIGDPVSIPGGEPAE
jgi:hypothetical protein